MMAERLAEIREQANNRWLHGFDPGTVRELLDHIAQLEAQRGGVVVVPAWNRSDFDKVPPEWSEMQYFGAGYALAASRIQPIPADRVLAEGMVGVDRGVLQLARNTIHAFVPTEGCCCDGSVGLVCVECTTSRLLIDLDSALRAQQAKGE